MARSSLLIVACVLVSWAGAISPLTFQGAKIFNSDGSQFFLKGVAYQLTPDDPLVDTNQCSQDISLMQELGTNSIRVYHVNPHADHDGCMSAFADAGIYVWLDLDTFNTTIQQTDPMWNQTQFEAFATVMDVFAGYDNLAGFWIGNEVINTAEGSSAAPYVKAAITDMRSYRDYKGYRDIPIGYSAADIAELRPMLQNYLACGDESTSVEFFGLNSYEWCGDATYQTSGYSVLNEQAQGYPKPIFFSETGCNVGGERTFADQAAILGPDMDDTWSGAIIYEWIEEANDYGLINYPNGGTSGSPSALEPDFSNLSSQWATLSPTGVNADAYSTSLDAPPCPAATLGWQVDGEVDIPTLGLSILTASFSSTFATPTESSSVGASSTPPSSSSMSSTASPPASSKSSMASPTKSTHKSAATSGPPPTSSSERAPTTASAIAESGSPTLPGEHSSAVSTSTSTGAAAPSRETQVAAHGAKLAVVGLVAAAFL